MCIFRSVGRASNTGVQNGVNRGWKLVQAVNGISPESLLDTHHAERHPVAARVRCGPVRGHAPRGARAGPILSAGVGPGSATVTFAVRRPGRSAEPGAPVRRVRLGPWH